MTARIVEQAKVITSRQYVAIARLFSSWRKLAWTRLTITTKK